MAWAEFSDIPLGYQGRAESNSRDSAPFDHYRSGSSQGDQHKIYIDDLVWTGRDRDLLLADRLKICRLCQHPAGDRDSWISSLHGDRYRDRGVGGNAKSLNVGRGGRLRLPEGGPDEPRQCDDDTNADQTHQQRTRHPRLGIAAAKPLGSIGHADILPGVPLPGPPQTPHISPHDATNVGGDRLMAPLSWLCVEKCATVSASRPTEGGGRDDRLGGSMTAMSRPALRVDAQGDRLRLLHVHAHPDDESSRGAATTAKYVAEGVDVVVATCTGGERGSILNPAMDRPDILANITDIRRQEMDRAREVLGIKQVWLGFVDSGLPEGDDPPPLPEGSFARTDLAVAVAPLVKVIRSFRPHVLTTYNESDGGYRHPDHIMCHRIGVAAFEAAADPDAYLELGEPWQPLKLYYSFTFHRDRTMALDRAMVARGLESPYTERLRDWPEDPKHAARITTRIDCANYYHIRDRALLAHATQIDPDGPWFAVPLEVHQSAWPTEEWQLARSLVETSIPEDDLFAGIAVPAESRVSA
jgi:mycothiol S-conjugate amidase